MYYDIKESGKRLSELRKMKGLTQQQVADELGMDVDTVRKNEQGRRGLSIDAAGIYAEYYHTTIDFIVHGKLEQARYQDCYHKALIYILGISEDTRNHFSQIYDIKSGYIKPECLHQGWQTSGSVRVVRLAFNLYTDGMSKSRKGKTGR